MNKKLSGILKIFISLILIIILLTRIDLVEVLNLFLGANVFYLLVVVFLFLLSLIIGGLSLYVFFLRTLTFKEFFLGFFKSWAYGFLLPGKMGDFSISYFFRDKVKMGQSNAYVAINKMVTLVITFVFVLILSIFQYFQFLNLIIFVFAILLIIFSIVGLFLRNKKLIKLNNFLEKYSFGFLKGFRSTFFDWRNNCVAIFSSCLLSVIRYLVLTITYVLILMSIGYQVDFWILFGALLIATVISIIPVTVGGTGLRENTFVQFLVIMGYAANYVASAILFVMVLKYLLVGLIILTNLFKKEKRGCNE